MKVYAIGTEVHRVSKDSYESVIIQRQGSYEEKGFPPVFNTRDKAENYLKTLDSVTGKTIVELELI